MDQSESQGRVAPSAEQATTQKGKRPAKRKAAKRNAPRGASQRGASRRGEGSSGNILQSFNVRQKFLLIALAFIIPIAALLVLYVSSGREQILQTNQELEGVEYLQPLGSALEAIPLHRDLSIRLLSGDTSLAAQRESVAAEVNTALSALAQTDQRYGSEFATSDYVNALINDWEALESQVLTLSPAESFDAHTALMSERGFTLLQQLGDRSGLGLDASLGDFYIAKLTLETLPRIAESLSQLRDQGAGVLTRQAITQDERTFLTNLVLQIEADLQEVRRDTTIASEGQPLYSEALAQNLGELESLVGFSVAVARYNLVNRFNPDLTPATYFGQATRAVDTSFAFFRSSISSLTQDLEARNAALERTRLVTSVSVLAGLILILLLVIWVARQIARPVSELATVAERVSQGDLSKFASVSSRDEFGVLAKTFNTAIVQLRETERKNELSRQQNEQLQANVGQFLDVAMDIADGDLTKRGAVSEDVLGNVIDAINLMVEEVAYLLRDVQEATSSVNEGAREMISVTDAISDSSEETAREAEAARGDVQGVTSSIRQMSESASQSATASQRALEASRQGEAAVSDTLEGMQGIRREVQSISKRIKSLGDRSLEISEIVETISQISSQTNLLALNAAIEASGAGEAGNRFAIVAGEVRKLAEDSERATQRIAGLIKNVQAEVQEVIGSVEDGTREVETGYRVATQAGERLREIAEIVTQSAALAQAISASTEAQVAGVEQVGSKVQSMARIASKTRETGQEGRQSAEKLQRLAQQLTSNLERFRLN